MTRLVGCRLPIQLAGMPRTSVPALVPAVCDAGGLGMLGGARLAADLAALASATDGPSGVAFLAPFLEPGFLEIAADLAALASATDGPSGVAFLAPFLEPGFLEIAAARARVVEPIWGVPDPAVVQRIHAGAALASRQVGSLAEARQAEGAGCDLVAVQCIEAGGHVRGTQPVATILADARAELAVPIVAAGGIGTYAQAARSSDGGADAVRCGTVFVAAAESGAHDADRRALIAATPADTVITTAFGHGWPDAPHRVLRDCVAALADAPEVVGTIREQGEQLQLQLPRGATANPTRNTVGMISAMPHYAGYSGAAVHAVRPAETSSPSSPASPPPAVKTRTQNARKAPYGYLQFAAGLRR